MRARVRREKETVVRGAICCKIQRSTEDVGIL